MASSSARYGKDLVGVKKDWRRQSDPPFALFHIGDVVEKNVSLVGIKQAVVVVDADSSGPYMLEHVAGRDESWDDVTDLSLALTAPEGDQCVTETPTAQQGYANAMTYFFAACVAHLVKLDLTPFHFAVEVDCCAVVASALRSLRFLALPPCGVNRRDSLEPLAWCCQFLEELHVASDRGSSCGVCRLPLGFTVHHFRLLDETTRLRRLSIDETANVPDLSFLQRCRVEELRLSVNCEKVTGLPGHVWTLGKLLRRNFHLTWFTLRVSRVALGVRLVKDLSMVRTLQHLCVLTTAGTRDSEAKLFLTSLESSLPHPLSLHAHYPDAGETVRTMTWRCSSRVIALYDRSSNDHLWCQTTFIALTGP
ncbi:hypothetical protein HPB50_026398 [Hyalomma asiaticum]|uniref:Uncharacterized protein n=1 Tax=Hyalomma asiaticum TaxID=266040 RepID=A0ACB7RZ28_HYAAI|nr:hypothetical protein HPB50_026398 [Hyalomma asiaticum]